MLRDLVIELPTCAAEMTFFLKLLKLHSGESKELEDLYNSFRDRVYNIMITTYPEEVRGANLLFLSALGEKMPKEKAGK